MIFLVTNFKLRVSWSGDRISRDQNRRSRDQDVKWQPGLLAIWWNSIYRSFPYEKISIILSFYLTWFKSCKSLLGLFSFVTDKKSIIVIATHSDGLIWAKCCYGLLLTFASLPRNFVSGQTGLSAGRWHAQILPATKQSRSKKSKSGKSGFIRNF